MTDIDTARWEHASWMCPRCGDDDGHPSRLQLVDSRDLSIHPRDVWEPEYTADLYERREAVESAVYCPDCETVFDVQFEPREEADE
jgi:rubredoxin